MEEKPSNNKGYVIMFNLFLVLLGLAVVYIALCAIRRKIDRRAETSRTTVINSLNKSIDRRITEE